jgi:hypothetical protein
VNGYKTWLNVMAATCCRKTAVLLMQQSNKTLDIGTKTLQREEGKFADYSML